MSRYYWEKNCDYIHFILFIYNKRMSTPINPINKKGLGVQSWNVCNYRVFDCLPKEIISMIIQYLIEPQFEVYLEEEKVYQGEKHEGTIFALTLESKVFIPNLDYEDIYGIDECMHSTCIKHNINFMNVRKDISLISEFIDNLKHRVQSALVWKVPKYSSQIQNSLVYIPSNENNIKDKLVSKIHQLTKEQYFTPTDALTYNIDIQYGMFKCCDFTFNISNKQRIKLINVFLEIIKKVKQYS
jgi:hypothetical protein